MLNKLQQPACTTRLLATVVDKIQEDSNDLKFSGSELKCAS